MRIDLSPYAQPALAGDANATCYIVSTIATLHCLRGVRGLPPVAIDQYAVANAAAALTPERNHLMLELEWTPDHNTRVTVPPTERMLHLKIPDNVQAPLGIGGRLTIIDQFGNAGGFLTFSKIAGDAKTNLRRMGAQQSSVSWTIGSGSPYLVVVNPGEDWYVNITDNDGELFAEYIIGPVKPRTKKGQP